VTPQELSGEVLVVVVPPTAGGRVTFVVVPALLVEEPGALDFTEQLEYMHNINKMVEIL